MHSEIVPKMPEKQSREAARAACLKVFGRRVGQSHVAVEGFRDCWLSAPARNRSMKQSYFELLAEINLAHSIIGENAFGIAFGNDLSFANNVGFLTNVEGFAHIVIGE